MDETFAGMVVMKFSRLLSATAVVLAALSVSANAAPLAGSQTDAVRTEPVVVAIAASDAASAMGMSGKQSVAGQSVAAAGAQSGRDRIYVTDTGSTASRGVAAGDAAFVRTTYAGPAVEAARVAAESVSARGETSKPNRYLMLLAGIGMLGCMVVRRTNG
jgi:hypothetical protein